MSDNWKKDFGTLQAFLEKQDVPDEHRDKFDALERLYQYHKEAKARLAAVRKWAQVTKTTDEHPMWWDTRSKKLKELRAILDTPTPGEGRRETTRNLCKKCLHEHNGAVAVPSQLAPYSNLCTACTLALVVEHLFPRGVDWEPDETGPYKEATPTPGEGE